MSIPCLHDIECDRIEEVDCALCSRSTDIATAFEDDIRVLGWNLPSVSESSGKPHFQPLTFLVISPLFTSITNICLLMPATRISPVPLDVKLMHRRSFISSCLHWNLLVPCTYWRRIRPYAMCHIGVPRLLAICTLCGPRAMTPRSLNRSTLTGPSRASCALKDVCRCSSVL